MEILYSNSKFNRSSSNLMLLHSFFEHQSQSQTFDERFLYDNACLKMKRQHQDCFGAHSIRIIQTKITLFTLDLQQVILFLRFE